MKKVVVAGGGVLGSQIAIQSAYKGFDVTVWLRSDDSIQRAKPKFEHFYQAYLKDIKGLRSVVENPQGCHELPRGLSSEFNNLSSQMIDKMTNDLKNGYQALKFETDLAIAFADADIVIEAVSENLEHKKVFYESIKPFVASKTIICTNTSTLLPSMIAQFTPNPSQFLALHFANEIWRHNTAEVMGHADTNRESFDSVVEFSRNIGMCPIPIYKEQPGYVLNSLLVPFLTSAQMLWAKGVSDPHSIDNTWKIATGAKAGPFEILDVVGLNTVYEINKNRPDFQDPNSIGYKIGELIKEKIDKGETGIAAGKGFYDYSGSKGQSK